MNSHRCMSDIQRHLQFRCAGLLPLSSGGVCRVPAMISGGGSIELSEEV